MKPAPLICPPDMQSYGLAAKALRAGECVVLPTKTVYGVAARAGSDDACQQLYAVKGRSFDKPLPVCVLSAQQAREIADVSALAAQLIERFWPGPLTLVLPLSPQAKLSRYVSAPDGTVALRLPDCEWTQILQDLGCAGPLALTSANPSGAPSPVTAQQAAIIGDKTAIIIDGGPCAIGAPSSLVKISENRSTLIREGALKRADFDGFDMNWTDI